MPRRRVDDKRRRILDAAVVVFARKGYFRAKVQEIAKKAGVADGTIYLYFKGKEDILVSLFDELMSEHVAGVRAELEAAPDAPAKLRLLAEKHLGALGADRDLAVVFQVELRQSTKFMERFTASWLKEYFEVLQEIIEQGQREGTLRPELPKKLVANAIFGMLDESVTSWVVGRKDYDLAQLAPAVVDLLLRGVAAPGAAAPGAAPRTRELVSATPRGGGDR